MTNVQQTVLSRMGLKLAPSLLSKTCADADVADGVAARTQGPEFASLSMTRAAARMNKS